MALWLACSAANHCFPRVEGLNLGHSFFFGIVTAIMYLSLVGDQEDYCESRLSPSREEKVGTSMKAGAAKREGERLAGESGMNTAE